MGSAPARGAISRSRSSAIGIMCNGDQGSVVDERAEHDVGVHEAFLRVAKGTGQRPDDAEAQRLPKPHRGLVGGHDKVELHRPKAETTRFPEGVLAHVATNPRTPG